MVTVYRAPHLYTRNISARSAFALGVFNSDIPKRFVLGPLSAEILAQHPVKNRFI